MTGRVYTLGRADYGRLGIGEDAKEQAEPTRVTGLEDKCKEIAAGGCVSFAITESGMLNEPSVYFFSVSSWHYFLLKWLW